jgi:hypothetical protein
VGPFLFDRLLQGKTSMKGILVLVSFFLGLNSKVVSKQLDWHIESFYLSLQ